MTAVTTHRERDAHAAVQPMLAGIPEAPLVPEIRNAMVGQLQRHAEVRITPDGQHAHLVVQIVQPRHNGVEGLPYVCMYTAHHGDVVALEAFAQRLHAGSLALVIYRGLDFDFHTRTLRTRHCDRITAIAPAEATQWLPERQPTQEHTA
jgi:hypothetical protein